MRERLDLGVSDRDERKVAIWDRTRNSDNEMTGEVRCGRSVVDWVAYLV